MRRFVSVFTSKRDKHGQSDKGSTADSLSSQMGSAPSKASLKPLTIPFLHSSSAAVTSPASSSYSTPHLSSGSTDPSSHSSGSSNDSASMHVQTLDDRQSLNLKRSDTKRSWKSWMGKKRAGSLKHRDRGDKVAPEPPLPAWEPLELPVSPQLLHPTFSSAHDTDDEMQTSSVSELGYVSPPDFISAPSQSPTTTTPPSPALALSNFSVLIRNSVLRTAVQPSPFIQPSSGPIFPRSCNRPHALSPSPSLRATTLRRRMLQRLDDPSLSLDDATILALGSRPTPVALSPSVLPDCDISYPGKSMKILSSSPGIHRWICRPPFEDRFAIFFSTDAGVDFKPVSSTLAVAALEYSGALDVMVDPDYELVLGKVLPFTPSESSPPSDAPSATGIDPAPMPTIEVPASAPVGLAAQAKNSYIANPSPLRIQHTRAPSEASPTILQEATSNTDSISTLQTATSVKKKPARASMAVKRVVRFAEDDEDEDDGVPLHLLRVKKKREEKAKFLRMEQQRRMRESFEEQKRQELEAMERERKRVAAQKEKEERDKRLFAEQVVASRLRSEQSRAGAYAVDSGSSTSLLVSSATSAHLRDGERNNPRPSKLYSSKHGQASSHRFDDASSASSRPPSLSFSPSPISPEHRSRPASTHSNTSSEDMRPLPGSRRDSYASLNGSIRSSMAMPYPMYPMWAGSHQSLNAMQMQMVPNMAAFSAVNDMPLLPPNAPFMKQSRQASPSPDRSRRSSTHSQQSSESQDANRSSTSLTEKKATSQWPNHRRQSTGKAGTRDGERSSKIYPQRTGDSFSSSSLRGQRPAPPPNSQSYSSPPRRGRPPLPNYNSAPQVPTPWTALPTLTGNTPTAMPPSSYSHSMPRSRNSGVVGPMGHDWRSTLIS